MDTNFAPSATAWFTAVNRSLLRLLFASTSRMRQFGQTAETIWTSSEISAAHPASGVGRGLASPPWLTLLKQPLAVVHGGRPNWARYTVRSASALGLSNASTIATVCPPPPPVVDGSAYADCRSAGPYPAGGACGESTPSRPATSVRASAKQDSSPVFTGPAHRARTAVALVPGPGAAACAGAGTAAANPAVATTARPAPSRRSRICLRNIWLLPGRPAAGPKAEEPFDGSADRIDEPAPPGYLSPARMGWTLGAWDGHNKIYAHHRMTDFAHPTEVPVTKRRDRPS